MSLSKSKRPIEHKRNKTKELVMVLLKITNEVNSCVVHKAQQLANSMSWFMLTNFWCSIAIITRMQKWWQKWLMSMAFFTIQNTQMHSCSQDSVSLQHTSVWRVGVSLNWHTSRTWNSILIFISKKQKLHKSHACTNHKGLLFVGHRG